jgi:hypothetical protein
LEFGKSQEGLQLPNIGWLQKNSDGVHPGWKSTDTCRAETVAQEFYGVAAEDLLVCINDPLLLKERENRDQVMAVPGDTGASDEDVVQVAKCEEGVHKALESHARILQAKQHGDEFEQAEWSDNRCPSNIGGGNRNLKVAFPEVQFTENPAEPPGPRCWANDICPPTL